MERVNGLLNVNEEDVLRMDKWTTFNDDAEPCDFQPFAHSANSYMFVYRQVDVPEVEFPPSIPPENLGLVNTILKAHPDTVRGKLATSFLYNNVGVVTRLEFNTLRDELIVCRQENHTLRGDMNALAQKMQTLQSMIATASGDTTKGLGD